MALSDSHGKVHAVFGNATTAEVNAGKVIVQGRPGKCIQVVGGHVTALGGAGETCTSVDFKDTAGTAIVAVAFEQAGLTENAQLDADAALNVTRTTYRKPLTDNKSLQIEVTGDDLATATSVDFYVEYVFVDPT